MLKKRIQKLLNRLNNGHPRSIKAKKQIIASFGLKGISILLNLAYVPLLLDYLGKEEYGIWLTLTSIVTWFSFFDIGLGNGLRNNFAKAKADNNDILARKFVSTTYAILGLIFSIILILFLIISNFVDWSAIYNTHNIPSNTLLSVSIIVFSFFLLRFVFQLIGVILLADQKPSINNGFNVISNLLCFIIILILKYTTKSSLPILGLVLSATPVLVLLIASLYFFNTNYKKYSPSFKYVDFKQSKTLLNLGFKFFILQVSGIIMYSSTNMLITQFSNGEDVAVYNISYKMFSVFIMVYGIILTPMWSATTEAFELKDFEWIRNFVKKMQKLGLSLIIFIIIALIFSNNIYHLWLGERIKIPFTISVLVALGSVVYVLTGVYVSFQNGIGKIKLTLIWVVIQTILYLPLAYFISIKLKVGFPGILIAGLICEIPVKYIQIMQYFKIINNKATGIWNQ